MGKPLVLWDFIGQLSLKYLLRNRPLNSKPQSLWPITCLCRQEIGHCRSNYGLIDQGPAILTKSSLLLTVIIDREYPLLHFPTTCFWQIIVMVSMARYDLHLGWVYLYVQYVSFHIIWLSVHSSINGIVGTWMFWNDFESRNVTCWILKIMKKPTRSFLPMSRFYLSLYQSLFLVLIGV